MYIDWIPYIQPRYKNSEHVPSDVKLEYKCDSRANVDDEISKLDLVGFYYLDVASLGEPNKEYE